MSNGRFQFANLLQTTIPAVRQSPLRLFLVLAVALCGLMTLTDLPSAAPVHAQEQQVTPTKESTGAAPPERPADLEASASHDSVTLTWTASTDDSVTHYAVLRRDRNADASGVFHVIDSNAGPATSYTDDTVSPEGSYVYRVKAVSPTGVSQWSSYARADTPAAPTPTPEPTPDPEDLAPSGLSVKVVSGDDGVIEGVALAWDAPAEDAASVTGYEILRAVGDGEMATLVADTGSTGATYTDDTATEAGESYAYRVKALRGQKASQSSDQAVAIIPKATPVEPEPGIAERQTTTVVWSATLTVGNLGSQNKGYQSPIGSLSPASFDIGETTYSVNHLSDNEDNGGFTGIKMTLAPSLGTADASGLTLHIGDDTSLSFADAISDVFPAVSQYRWSSSDALGWSTGEIIILSITQERQATDATLSALSLSGVTLAPSFDAETLEYTASVGNAVDSTTVTATANDDGATLEITPGDADAATDGHQVALGVGDTTVSVTVTAEDGTTTQTYAVTVTRADAAPTVSSVAVTSDPGADETYALGVCPRNNVLNDIRH